MVSSAHALLIGIAARARSPVALALLVLSLSAFAVKIWSNACADRLGTEIAAGLSAVVPTLPASAKEEIAVAFAEAEPPFDARPSVQGVVFSSKPGAHSARSS